MKPGKSLLYKYMPFEVNTEPYIIGNRDKFIELNHERIVKQYRIKSNGSLLLLSVMLLVPWLCFGYFYASGLLAIEDSAIVWIVFIPYSIICFVNILFWFTGPEKTIVYDRLKGDVTLPNSLWGKPLTIPFTQMKAVLSQVGRLQAPGLILAARFPRRSFLDVFKPSIHLGFGLDPFRAWAFIVWYMDRNRPLPPGEVFDPYRDIDEKRRASEGYPMPLFPSR